MSMWFRDFRHGAREQRLIGFGEFSRQFQQSREGPSAQPTDREQIRERVQSERQAREERAARVQFSTHGLDREREDSTREAFLMGEMPDSERNRQILEKANSLEALYDSGDLVQGIEFQILGSELRVLSADIRADTDPSTTVEEGFVGFAISRIAGEIQVLRDRIANATGDREDIDYVRTRAEEQIRQWETVLRGFELYRSQYAVTERVKAEVRANPRRINDITAAWREAHREEYTALLRDAAVMDVQLLIGKEAFFTPQEFHKIVTEVAVENPAALVFYPEELKRDASVTVLNEEFDPVEQPNGGTAYRALMVEAASRDGQSILEQAHSEYERHWKNHPDQYRALVVAAINQNPALYVYWHASLRKDRSVEATRAVINEVNRVTFVQIFRNIRVGDLSSFAEYQGGYGALADWLIGPANAPVNVAVAAIAENASLWNHIKSNDPALYTKLRDAVARQDPDMARLRALDHVREDEDLAIDRLRSLLEQLFVEPYVPDPTDPFSGTLKPDALNFLRENRDEIRNFPPQVWESDGLRELFLQLFRADGSLFANAPDWMKETKEIVLPVLTGSADAYAHIDPSLQNDPELLSVALQSQEDGRGNLQWNHVGSQLKRDLRAAGISGLPTTDADRRNLLRVLTLDLAPETAAPTAEGVHSALDSWPEADRKDPEMVRSYLMQRLGEHPEYVMDLDPELREDIGFVADLAREHPAILRHFTEVEHLGFAADSPRAYNAMIRKALVDDPSLIDAVPARLQRRFRSR